jgi:hypothetical protein
MKKSSIVACALGAALICAAPVSVQWSPEKTLSLSVDSARLHRGTLLDCVYLRAQRRLSKIAHSRPEGSDRYQLAF